MDCTVVEICASLIENNAVYLDTETTGLGPEDQIVELAIVDGDGAVLLNTLVKPTIRIPAKATAIHGITDGDVAEAPSLLDLHGRIRELLQDRQVVIYNAEYDLRMLRQSAAAHGLAGQGPDVEWFCAMELYAELQGEWDSYHDHWRWHKLEAAGRQCKLELPDNLHRALADAELTRRLVAHMAEQAKPTP